MTYKKVCRFLKRLAISLVQNKVWPWTEKLGLHVIPDTYNYPIPDFKYLKEAEIWERTFNEEDLTLSSSEDIFSKLAQYKNEFSQYTKLGNKKVEINRNTFGEMDSFVYHYMISEAKPSKIVEIGDGGSTKVAANASLKYDKKTDIICMDPNPSGFSKRSERITKVYQAKLEGNANKIINTIGEHDILFLDGTHTVHPGSDSVEFFLRILPNVPKNVLIHVHDVFLPYDYSEGHHMSRNSIWAEQYILHAFLLYNESFNVIFADYWSYRKRFDILRRIFPNGWDQKPGSRLWMKRI